jgi:hypothetical protein
LGLGKRVKFTLGLPVHLSQLCMCRTALTSQPTVDCLRRSPPLQANRLEAQLGELTRQRDGLQARSAELESELVAARQQAQREQRELAQTAAALAGQLEAAQRGAADAASQVASVKTRSSLLEKAWDTAVKVDGVGFDAATLRDPSISTRTHNSGNRSCKDAAIASLVVPEGRWFGD